MFKFALETGMLKTPILFGPGFKRPSKKTLRLDRAKKGPKLFTVEELHKLLDVAGIQLKAMILLASNAGLGNSDLANMPISAVNLQTGWGDFSGPKTGIARRFPSGRRPSQHYAMCWRSGRPPAPATPLTSELTAQRQAVWASRRMGRVSNGAGSEAVSAVVDQHQTGQGTGASTDPHLASLQQDPYYKSLQPGDPIRAQMEANARNRPMTAAELQANPRFAAMLDGSLDPHSPAENRPT